MIILQFIKYQLSPAMFCGFLLKSYKKRLKTILFSRKPQRKHCKISKKRTLKSKIAG